VETLFLFRKSASLAMKNSKLMDQWNTYVPWVSSTYIFEKVNGSTLHLKPIITILSETFH